MAVYLYKRTSILLMIILDVITYNFYSCYWYFSRRKMLKSDFSEREITWEPYFLLIVNTLNLLLILIEVFMIDKNPLMLVGIWIKHKDIFMINGLPPFTIIASIIVAFRYRAILNLQVISGRISGFFTFLFQEFYLQYWINRQNEIS